MFKSVFAKYIAAFTSIIFISFLVLVVLIVSMVNNYAVTAKQEQLENSAVTVAGFLSVRMHGDNTDPAAFAQMVTGLQVDVDRILSATSAMGEEISVLITDNSGEVLRMGNGGNATGSSAVIPRSVMEQAHDGVQSSELSELAGVFSVPQYYYASPVYTTDGTGVCGMVFACAPSATLDTLLGMMIKTVIIGSAWVMLAALMVVYVISERVIGPLRDMSKMAKAFAAGNFDARVPVRGKDEVAELALAFNNMAGALSQLETMRNTFIANVSHDLRTPMTTISGFIDNILSGAIPPERHTYYLGLIKNEVQRLARLVASLLDISRIQAGDRKFEMKPFDICEMGRLILISFEAKIEAKHLDVEFECDRERMEVLADHDAIYQIFYNICDNAVKFSREGGKLRVRLNEISGRRVRIGVYNEGEGIAAADLPFVFERFYKGDKSRGLDRSGVGLGMFISKTIIEAHQQKIWVESEEGRYCEFLFTLPLCGD